MSDTEFVHQPKRRRIEIEEDEDEYGGDSITEQPSDSHSISHGADGSDITLRQEEPQPLLEPPTPLDNQQEHTLKYEQAELPPLSLSLTTPSESLSSSSALLTSMPTTAPSPSVAFAEPLPPSSSSSSSVFTTPAPSKTGVHRQSTASSVLSTVRPSPAKSYKAGKKQEATSVLCDYCRKDIGHIVRIKCVDCDFTLCLECFAGGCQVFQHKNDHAYRVVDRVSIPIFEQDWGADEELVLLEAIEKHGFGNWADVAKNLRSKGQHKCEEHYHSVYLKDVPVVPDPYVPGSHELKGVGNTVGYIPQRNDFDTEHDNDAETKFADMEFREEDTPKERQMKMDMLKRYNCTLAARAERKKLILERGLLFPNQRQGLERVIYDNMRPFSRFHSADEHESFLKGLNKEFGLRKRIMELQMMRLQGFTKLADAETAKKEREERKKEEKEKESQKEKEKEERKSEEDKKEKQEKEERDKQQSFVQTQSGKIKSESAEKEGREEKEKEKDKEMQPCASQSPLCIKQEAKPGSSTTRATIAKAPKTPRTPSSALLQGSVRIV